MNVIAITGTPGTGKTIFAKQLAKGRGYPYLEVNALITKNKLQEGYDKKLKTKLIDTKTLVKFLKGHIKKINEKGVVVDSHLSHYLPPSFVDACYVTTCDLSILKQRLKKRGYSVGKIKDNLEAEAFHTCLIEAQELGHTPIIVDTSKPKRKKPRTRT